MKILIETITDEIADKLNKGKNITEKSWLRFGDKNRLTRSIKSLYLSERGIAVDKLATEIVREPQFENLEESDVIERIIDFTYDYPTRKDLNAYFSSRAKEQKTKVVKNKDSFKNEDETCLLKSLKKELSTSEIIEEMTDFEQDPERYFGKLLITTTCKNDIFTQPVPKQKKIARDILKKLNIKPSKVKKKKKQLTLNQGLRKLAGWISELK